jgi:hypothetical protein
MRIADMPAKVVTSSRTFHSKSIMWHRGQLLSSQLQGPSVSAISSSIFRRVLMSIGAPPDWENTLRGYVATMEKAEVRAPAFV